MKKIILKVITALIAVCMVLSMTGCDKVVKLQITMSVYNVDDSVMEEKTLTYSMYENLAKTAVTAVKGLVADGYYNDSVFYKQSSYNGLSVSSQMFFGGLERKNGQITQTAPVAVPNAEFKNNGTEGSNLTNNEGYLGLWRNWDSKIGYKTNGFGNSYSTMYMPTSSLASSYDNYFCVFAKYAADADLELIQDIKGLLNNSDYTTEYTCFYEADEDGRLVTVNEAPVWVIMETEDFNETEETLNVYAAENDPDQRGTNRDQSYERYTLTVLNADRLVIKSIKTK